MTGKVGVRARERKMAENYRAAAEEFEQVQRALRDAAEDIGHFQKALIESQEENSRLRVRNARLMIITGMATVTTIAAAVLLWMH